MNSGKESIWNNFGATRLETYRKATPMSIATLLQNYIPLLVGSRVYTTHLYDIHRAFASRCFCRSSAVRRRWNTSNEKIALFSKPQSITQKGVYAHPLTARDFTNTGFGSRKTEKIPQLPHFCRRQLALTNSSEFRDR